MDARPGAPPSTPPLVTLLTLPPLIYTWHALLTLPPLIYTWHALLTLPPLIYTWHALLTLPPVIYTWQVHLLRRLQKEVTGRVRSLRFFENVRKLQSDGGAAAIAADVAANGTGGASSVGGSPSRRRVTSPRNLALLSCCGHVGECGAVERAASDQLCIEHPACKVCPPLHTALGHVANVATPSPPPPSVTRGRHPPAPRVSSRWPSWAPRAMARMVPSASSSRR